jgi:hypothetical protein
MLKSSQRGTAMEHSMSYRGYVGSVELEGGVLTGRVLGLPVEIPFQGNGIRAFTAAFRLAVDEWMCREQRNREDGGENRSKGKKKGPDALRDNS